MNTDVEIVWVVGIWRRLAKGSCFTERNGGVRSCHAFDVFESSARTCVRDAGCDATDTCSWNSDRSLCRPLLGGRLQARYPPGTRYRWCCEQAASAEVKAQEQVNILLSVCIEGQNGGSQTGCDHTAVLY